MKVYYHHNRGEIMTEEEAIEYSKEVIDELPYTEFLSGYSLEDLWDFMKEEFREEIMEINIKKILNEEFTFREIEEEENGSI